MSKAPAYIPLSELHAISLGEAVDKAREDTKKQASANRIPDQSLLENHDMARGSELEANELIRRLERLDPKILIQKGGIEGAVAVRYPLPDENGDIKPQYVTGFYLQKLPEYSSVTLDNMGLPHREVRGWRSVLMALIDRGILDRGKVDLLFGPASGQRTGLWYRALQAQGKN
jgi:hypothetical protein